MRRLGQSHTCTRRTEQGGGARGGARDGTENGRVARARHHRQGLGLLFLGALRGGGGHPDAQDGHGRERDRRSMAASRSGHETPDFRGPGGWNPLIREGFPIGTKYFQVKILVRSLSSRTSLERAVFRFTGNESTCSVLLGKSGGGFQNLGLTSNLAARSGPLEPGQVRECGPWRRTPPTVLAPRVCARRESLPAGSASRALAAVSGPAASDVTRLRAARQPGPGCDRSSAGARSRLRTSAGDKLNLFPGLPAFPDGDYIHRDALDRLEKRARCCHPPAVEERALLGGWWRCR